MTSAASHGASAISPSASIRFRFRILLLSALPVHRFPSSQTAGARRL
jgi:hypothetical protein